MSPPTVTLAGTGYIGYASAPIVNLFITFIYFAHFPTPLRDLPGDQMLQPCPTVVWVAKPAHLTFAVID